MLLFKDAIRLFAAYNEGIINLLGKYSCFLQCSALGGTQGIDSQELLSWETETVLL